MGCGGKTRYRKTVSGRRGSAHRRTAPAHPGGASRGGRAGASGV